MAKRIFKTFQNVWPFFNIMNESANLIRPVKIVILGITLAGIYMFKVNNRNTRTRCQVCSKLTIKTPEWRQWRRSGFFIVNSEHISHLVLMFLLSTLNAKNVAKCQNFLWYIIATPFNCCSNFKLISLFPESNGQIPVQRQK